MDDDKSQKKYIILRTLGKGSFGKVKEAIHVLSGEKIAIKILEKVKIKKEDDLVRIRREINILSKVQHPNIIQLYEVIETNKYFFFVMEYAMNGELSYYIEKQKRLSEIESCKLFRELISAVEYLHEIGCAHRDIKPSNILIDEDKNLKLIDFGLGNLYTEEEKLKTSCGSPCYAAPEIINGELYNPITVDVWSSGITLYAMLCGFLPFDEDSKSVLYKKILACDYTIPKFVSPEAQDLIKKILVRPINQRYTISQIKQHPWFNTLKKKLPRGFVASRDKIPISSVLFIQTTHSSDSLPAEKYSSGKFTSEDHQALQESIRAQSIPQETIRLAQQPQTQSFLGSTNVSMIQHNLPLGLSQASSRNNSREPSKTDRPLPHLNPQLNVQDINYSLKDKPSGSNLPLKQVSTHNHIVPNMFGATATSSRNSPPDFPTGFHPNPARDPRNEFKRVPSSSANSKTVQNHSVLLYPPSYNSIKSTIQSPNMMISSHLKGNASKSFDLDSQRYPTAQLQLGLPHPQQSLMSQTGRKFKSPQIGDYSTSTQPQGDSNPNFKRGSSAGHQESPLIPSSVLSPSHTMGAGQYQSEPKSRKLLEMMLKKITKVGTTELESERRSTNNGSIQQQAQVIPSSAKSKPSHEVLKPQFLEMKSLSLDPSNGANKKKLLVSAVNRNSGHDSTHNSRRSSKDSVYNHQVPQPTNYAGQQTPSSNPGHQSLKPNAFVAPGANTVGTTHQAGSGYGNVISLNKSKLIQIRNVKMRSPLAPMSGGSGQYATHGGEVDPFNSGGGHNYSHDYPGSLGRKH